MESQLAAYWLTSCALAPPHPEAERQACDSQSLKARGCYNLSPETASSTKLWAGSQLLTTSSWDPGWLTSTRRVAAWYQLSRGDIRHTWDGALTAHLGNPAAGTREVIKMHGPPGTVCSPSTWLPELVWPGKDTKCTPSPQRPSQNCVWLSPVKIQVSSSLLQGLWVQQT